MKLGRIEGRHEWYIRYNEIYEEFPSEFELAVYISKMEEGELKRKATKMFLMSEQYRGEENEAV